MPRRRWPDMLPRSHYAAAPLLMDADTIGRAHAQRYRRNPDRRGVVAQRSPLSGISWMLPTVVPLLENSVAIRAEEPGRAFTRSTNETYTSSAAVKFSCK